MGYMEMENKHPHRLAWHETLMLHEIVMASSNHLIQFKNTVGKIKDPELHQLYRQAIKGTENNLKELIPFYSYDPSPVREASDDRDDKTAFYAGALLGAVKGSIKDYAATITETATFQLRQTLVKQLNHLIDLHYKVFGFMYEKGYYPAYNLDKLRENDVKTAVEALRK